MQMYQPYWNQRENLSEDVNMGGPQTAALYKRRIYNV